MAELVEPVGRQRRPFSAASGGAETHCAAYSHDFSSIRKTWFGRLVLGASAAAARQRSLTQGTSLKNSAGEIALNLVR